MSTTGLSNISTQPSVKKRLPYRKKTEAEKLQPFSWDKNKDKYPPNTDNLRVPRHVPIIEKDTDVCLGDEPTMEIGDQPQSPINQVPAFNGPVGAVATTATAAPAAIVPEPVTHQSMKFDMDHEHRMAKLQREARIKQDRLKKKQMEQEKQKNASISTQNGGVTKKKKQVTVDQVGKSGAGPSKVPSAAAKGADSPALITPAPAPAPAPAPIAGPSAAKEPTTKATAPPKKPTNPLLIRKKITKPTKTSPTPSRSPSAAAVREKRKDAPAAAAAVNVPVAAAAAVAVAANVPVAAAVVAAATTQMEDVTPSPAPSANNTVVVPTTPGSLIQVVMNHVNPLIPVLPRGTVAGYISFFIKLSKDEKVEHANVITALANYPIELQDFVKRNQN